MAKHHFRRLIGDDAEAWAALRREALEEYPLVFGASMPDDVGELAVQFASRVIEPEAAIVGGFTDQRLVGTVGIRRHTSAKERHKATIWGVYVTTRQRECGVGTHLLQAAMDQARLWNGVTQIHLAVSEVAESAKRLYERNGFVVWGREPRALCWQGQCADEFHMVRNV